MEQTRSAVTRKPLEAVESKPPARPAQANGNGFIDQAMIAARLRAMHAQLEAHDKQMAERAEELRNMARARDQMLGAIRAYEEMAARPVEKV